MKTIFALVLVAACLRRRAPNPPRARVRRAPSRSTSRRRRPRMVEADPALAAAGDDAHRGRTDDPGVPHRAGKVVHAARDAEARQALRAHGPPGRRHLHQAGQHPRHRQCACRSGCCSNSERTALGPHVGIHPGLATTTRARSSSTTPWASWKRSRASRRASRTPTTSSPPPPGAYVLTLFEHIPRADLPFYVGLMDHLARHEVACPAPLRARRRRRCSARSTASPR